MKPETAEGGVGACNVCGGAIPGAVEGPAGEKGIGAVCPCPKGAKGPGIGAGCCALTSWNGAASSITRAIAIVMATCLLTLACNFTFMGVTFFVDLSS